MTPIQKLPFDISTLLAAYSEGLSPSEVIGEVYRRNAELGDEGIFIHLCPETEAQEAVKQLGPFNLEKKPLWGIPFAIKDNIDAKGLPTTAACPEFSYIASDDAYAVNLLKAAGAILIGKTNLDQFATGLVGVRSPYPIPKNAIRDDLVPGGSSSGSAVAVAQGLLSFALGTDTAGSGRVPAGLNNIVGLKPSLGALSVSGVVPACLSLDCVSIFALNVPDAFKVFSVASQYDEKSPYARPIPKATASVLAPKFRIGIPDETSIEFLGDDLAKASFNETIERLEKLGAEIVPLDFEPLYAVARLLYEGAWVAERHASVGAFIKHNLAAANPTVANIILGAEGLSATDAFNGIYKLEALKRQLEPIISKFDALCVPTFPKPVTLAEIAKEPVLANSGLGTYTNFVNLLDMCGIAVPSAQRADGLPGSVTLLAPRGADGRIAAIAHGLHKSFSPKLGATDWSLADKDFGNSAAQEGEIEIVVVGAHLSGMALNHELTSRGGRFLRAIKTKSLYRFYALPSDGGPRRPGLIRVGSEEGVAIEAEVWALPEAGFGSFVNTIPSPLGVGKLMLEDGTAPTGFLCEAIAIKGAEDISHLGGWRAFITGLSKSA